MQTRDQSPTLDYITRTFVTEPSWIATARNAGETLRAGMQLSPFEGHLLRWMVQVSGAATILEIGTFMGLSAMWMANALPASGQLITLEASAEYAAYAAQHFAASPDAAKIRLVEGDAHASIAALPADQRFDLVFIDAEKAGYARYLDAVLPRLNPRGWIVGDNTLLFGALSGEQPDAARASAKAAMAQFNATLADSTRFESVLLPTPEGMTIARLKA